MDNEKRKELLKDIQMKKMETKSQLQKVSFLLNQNKIFKKEMDALLDRLKMLEELENEIRRMK
jgi:nicotinic acid mononucleotide adenylyltransferase